MKFEKNFAIAYISEQKKIWFVIEACIITCLCLLVANLINPHDPFSLAGPIPWLSFAPIFCCLFFGLFQGLLSLVILLMFLLFFEHNQTVDNVVLREYIVGLFSLTLIVGLFSSFWRARIRHVEHLNRYVRQHLENLSRDYYLLRISHDRLEHAYIVKPLSLRDAFYQLNKEINENKGVLNEVICEKLLGICSHYCSINSAVFCLYDEMTHTAKTLATLGKPFSVNTADSLIKQSVEKKMSTYVAINALRTDQVSDYLAVIPLQTVNNKIKGFIIIKDMPFWSLIHDNLEVLSVIAAAFALHWTTAKKVVRQVKIFPDCPTDFLRELLSLVSLQKHHKVDSALVGILIPECYSQENIVYSLEHHKRSLDYVWVLSGDNGARIVLTLLPLTSMEGMNGYRERISDWLKSKFGEDIIKNGFIFRAHQIDSSLASKQMKDLIKELTHALD